MGGISLRHPRYTILVIVALITGIYFLLPSAPVLRLDLHDAGLPERLERSHVIYEKMLHDREQLIKKHGPTPKDIALFPPDVHPWPPYTVWDFFPAVFNCPHEVERLGALGDGGKWLCGMSRVATKSDCIVYSFGINYESSFEAEILANSAHCQIWGYDFSVRSFGPQIPLTSRGRTHFKAVGLSGSDNHGPGANPPMYTLETLMRENGHTHIDILKIDIEGWEFETITTLLKPYIESGKPLPFGQLSMEIHIWNKTFEEYLTWWKTLEAAGLRPFWTEPNLVYQNYNRDKHTPDLAEYSFLNVKGKNIFIHDPPHLEEAPGHPHEHPQ